MPHTTVDVHEYRLAIVADQFHSWTLQPEDETGNRFPLVVNGTQVARFFIREDGLYVHYRSVNNGAIVVDGEVLHGLSEAYPIPTGTMVEIKDGWIDVTTRGPVARFLCGFTTDIGHLFRVRQQYLPIDRALSVWEDTAVSPDYLVPSGRAVYDQIVSVTGRKYKDRAD